MKPMTIRIIACAALSTSAMAEDLSKPIAPPDLVFEEKDGLVAIEAEHFIKQEKTDKRAWYLTTKDKAAGLEPDPDPSHIAGVSGGAYLEILPDTRRTHGDKLIVLENFSPEPGHMAILSYKVHFNTPGKYWLWARVHSTGSEDNGLHFGINGTWPPSAQRWQTVEKRKWHWRSAQRTAKQHSGVPGILTLDVPSAGEHTIQVCMREDGIELDKILLVNRKDYQVEGLGPDPVVKSGKLPAAFEMVKADPAEAAKPAPKPAPVRLAINATELDLGDGGYYLDQGRWLAINPEARKSAKVQTASPFPDGRYDITLEAVGESDGSSSYAVSVNGSKVGEHTCPLATETYETGPKFHGTFKNIAVASGDVIEISSKVASSDGLEWSRARWAALSFKPADDATRKAVANYRKPAPKPKKPAGPPLQQPRKPDGDGSVAISGDLKQWHKVTLTLDGPYAHELDRQPNPFTDRALWVRFRHESGKPDYLVPGYFAADGNAAESSAVSGTKWRAHLSPDKPGKWEYTVNFRSGGHAAFRSSEGQVVAPFDGKSGHFTVAASDKAAPDFRGRGRLAYVGKHHLQFRGDMSYFLKAGPDAPETAMAFADFDDTRAIKKNVPVKSWAPHVKDWKKGDPTWKGGKGKGLIGGLNYLAAKGMNAWSFLPYNVGGDGANIWPFTGPRDKFHYDCSKLDQWGIVFDHATSKGIYLHFKMQENEMDDNRLGHQLKQGNVPASLDGGKLGPERMLYCRELIARFGHALALNWNIGEETTQTTEEIRDMVEYIRGIDPYQHHVVIHTFPQQQDKVYKPLLGFKGLTGASLQNRWDHVHRLTVKWIKASAEAGHPWVAANDEQGSADTGVPPDPDYPGKTKTGHTIHDIRRMTLWGNLMAGGAGVEYYFGYKLAENDLLAEDWRSRDQSWDFARIALEFFTGNDIPFHEMSCRDELIGNPKHDNSKFCFAKEGEIYLVYLPKGGETSIELPEGTKLGLTWFNPRSGEMGETSDFNGDKLTAPDGEDWLAVLR